MAVFPENMDRLDLNDTRKSLSTIQDYIRYITERMEFAMRNMTKTVSAAGVSSAEVYLQVQEQAQALAALASTFNTLFGNVNALSGTVTSLQGSVGAHDTAIATLQKAVSTLQETVTTMQNTVAGINGSISAIEGTVSALDTRVTALENAQTS